MRTFRNLLLSFYIFREFLATAAPAESRDPAEEVRNGRLEVECLVERGKPTREDCATGLGIDVDSHAVQETFVLAFNDPIEYFRYESRYAFLGGFWETHTMYWRPPVLGGIRDRFVNSDPFDDTLLFTVTVAKLGYGIHLKPVSLSAEAGASYVKQRYSPNFIHSDSPRNPEANRIYGFAQFGGAGRVSLAIDAFQRIKILGHLSLIMLRKEGVVYAEREANLRLRFALWKGELASSGLVGQVYQKVHGLRRDGITTRFSTARMGLFVEF